MEVCKLEGCTRMRAAPSDALWRLGSTDEWVIHYCSMGCADEDGYEIPQGEASPQLPVNIVARDASERYGPGQIGLFAARDFEARSIIIDDEQPWMWHNGIAEDLITAQCVLDQGRDTRWMTFDNPFKPDELTSDQRKLSPELIQLACRLRAYYFIANTGLTMIPFGIGIYRRASIFNHACVPNCGWSVNPNTRGMRVHSLYPIRAGEELTISYRGEDISLIYRELREKLLVESAGIASCRCDACLEDLPYGQARFVSSMKGFGGNSSTMISALRFVFSLVLPEDPLVALSFIRNALFEMIRDDLLRKDGAMGHRQLIEDCIALFDDAETCPVFLAAAFMFEPSLERWELVRSATAARGLPVSTVDVEIKIGGGTALKRVLNGLTGLEKAPQGLPVWTVDV